MPTETLTPAARDVLEERRRLMTREEIAKMLLPKIMPHIDGQAYAAESALRSYYRSPPCKHAEDWRLYADLTAKVRDAVLGAIKDFERGPAKTEQAS
jgi:hypothetical protein